MTKPTRDAALRAPMLVTLLLLPLVYWVTHRVLTGPFSAEVQSMVVGHVMGAAMGSAVTYWLGSSAGSARKDDRPSAPPAEGGTTP